MGTNFELSSSALAALTLALGGAKASAWQERLPHKVEKILDKWNLRVINNLKLGTRGLVLHCSLPDSQQVILKVPFETNELAKEFDALEVFAAHGVKQITRVYAYQPGALATYYIPPHKTVNRSRTDVDPVWIINLMQDLHKPVALNGSTRLQSLSADLMARLDKAESRLPLIDSGLGLSHIDRARDMVKELEKGVQENFLVHGDLHSGNILQTTGGLIACDPKGAIGDRHYDIAMWTLKADLSSRIEYWTELFAQNGYEKERIKAWFYVIALHESVAYLYHQKSLERLPIFMKYLKKV